jgi:serine/threonine-protein phosphatase 6 regulatory ankyrin repeat subunit B
LHRAVRNGHAATASALLAAAPESLDAANENGWTALIYASRWGHFELASTLLQAGADVHARTLDERCALSCARDGNHSRVAVLLETAGASSGGASRACTRMCGF